MIILQKYFVIKLFYTLDNCFESAAQSLAMHSCPSIKDIFLLFLKYFTQNLEIFFEKDDKYLLISIHTLNLEIIKRNLWTFIQESFQLS